MEDYEEFNIFKIRGNKMGKATTELVTKVFLSGFKSKEKLENPFDKIAFIKSVKNYIQDPNKTWYCVYSELGDIVSIIAVIENNLKNNKGRVNPSYGLELQAISTIPSYRGKGFVRDLMKEICKNQKTGLWLEVNEDNRAFGVYKKIGFEIFEEIPQKDDDDDDELGIYEEGERGRRFKMYMKC